MFRDVCQIETDSILPDFYFFLQKNTSWRIIGLACLLLLLLLLAVSRCVAAFKHACSAMQSAGAQLAVTQQQALQIYCSERQRRTFLKTVIKIQFLIEYPFSISHAYFALHQQLWIWVGLFFYLKCFFQCFSNCIGLSANSGSFGGSRQPRQAVVLCTKCIPDRRVESLRQFASLMAGC